MNIFDIIYKNIINFFYNKDANEQMDRINAEVEEEFNISDPFLIKLKDDGYQWSSIKQWWWRKWETTSTPKESIIEAFKEDDNGEWKQLMIGYGDRVFYEEKVPK